MWRQEEFHQRNRSYERNPKVNARNENVDNRNEELIKQA